MGQITQSGGAKLRALRLQAGKTQLFIELEADLGSGYLQRIESGKVLQPEKLTLARILTALETTYTERSAVFELFGYTVDRPLPNDTEIIWACSVSNAVLQEIALPAYLLDCAHRLLAWNQLIPQFLSLTPGELEALTSISLIEVWFTQFSALNAIVHNPDAFYPQMIHALEHEMHPFQHEQWCKDLLAHWLQTLPPFRDYWLKRDQSPTPAIAARLLKPLQIRHAQAGLLQFRLAVESLNPDTRFRIVYYIPADATTEHFLRSIVNQATNTIIF